MKTVPTTTTSEASAQRITVRCPACGQPLEPSIARRCPLCDFDFGDDRVTGGDVTPYAKAYAGGESRWRTMCAWVWLAGSGRLKHLALMQGSSASRAFARVNLLVLAAGLAVVQATRYGWRQVTDSPLFEPTGFVKPAGRGWLHLASAPRPLPPGQAPGTAVDLWWNPAQTVITMAATFVVGLLALWVVMILIRVGLAIAHRETHRGEQRMTAAVLYSTAWAVPMWLAALLLGLRPVSLVSAVVGWGWVTSKTTLGVAGAVTAGGSLALWWFWLVRLAATTPANTRGRVLAFCTLGVPLIVATIVAGWWFVLEPWHERLFRALNLHF